MGRTKVGGERVTHTLLLLVFFPWSIPGGTIIIENLSNVVSDWNMVMGTVYFWALEEFSSLNISCDDIYRWIVFLSWPQTLLVDNVVSMQRGMYRVDHLS